DPTVFLDLLDAYGKDRKRIIAGLEKAKGEAASPVGDAVGECSSLSALLDGTDNGDRDELRRRLKAALRRLGGEVRLLVVPTGRDRVAAVQFFFRGGGRRDYLIQFTARAAGERLPEPSIESGRLDAALDLRKPAHARRLAAVLLRIAL